MIERLNAATNLIGMCMVMLGAFLEVKHPGSGTAIVTGGFGLLSGKALAQAAQQPPKPPEEQK